jgi:WD40 repeat protein
LKIKKIWDCNCDEQFLGLEIGTLIGDTQQILTFTKSGKIMVFSIDGKILLEEDISLDKPIWNAKICDIDNDGNNEILIAGLDGLLRVFKNRSLTLEPFWAHQFGASIGGILIHDINNDGIKEVIAHSLDKSIRVLNSVDGSLVWGQLFEEGIGEAIIWTDRTGKNKEIIACSNDGTVRVFESKKGELLWFKRYSNKIRCVSYLNSTTNDYLICGGDDKIIHIINKNNKKEIKNIQLEEIVWKLLSFPPGLENKNLISTYSFQYFNSELSIEQIQFNSKIICINDNLEIIWELNNINAEKLYFEPKFENNRIFIGTTKGNMININELTGEIKMNVRNNSCINDVKWDFESKRLFTCTDKGTITAYFLEDN